MSETSELPAGHPGYLWILNCPCGERLEGDSEDHIVEVAQAHLAAEHPDMADSYEPHHILFMATKYRRPNPTA